MKRTALNLKDSPLAFPTLFRVARGQRPRGFASLREMSHPTLSFPFPLDCVLKGGIESDPVREV